MSKYGKSFMVFSDLMNDRIEIRKADGAVEANLRASVQGTRIYMNAGTLAVESGDVIVRTLSTGVVEHYRVVDPGFHEAHLGFPAHYQMSVMRVEGPHVSADGIDEGRRQRLFRQWDEIGVDIIKQDLANGGFRYVGGPPETRRLAMKWVQIKEKERQDQAMQVHVSGPNARVNVQSTDMSTNIAAGHDVFGPLRDALANGVMDSDERHRLTVLIDELEVAKDKKGFLAAYQKLIGAAADHMTLLAPFLPALGQLIQGLVS